MPESLLTWFNRFGDDPKKVDARLKGRPVLLYDPPNSGETSESEEYQFRTQSGLEVPTVSGGDPLAIVVEKTKDNAFQRRITIGRTGNNDIVLDDSSVSRFHAWLQVDEVSREWGLCDAGSRNGTDVAGGRIIAKVAAKLSNGTKVKIGAVELTFYSAEGFMKMLRKRLEEG